MDSILAIALAVVLIMIPTLFLTGWFRIFLTWCHTSLVYFIRKYWKKICRQLNRTENSLTENEDNFLRMFRLMSNVAPKAVRDLFNQHYKPSSLIATLARDKAKITNHLLNRHIISRKQMDLLYPTSGITSSENYDITLMICLLRNMTNILQPTLGYDKLPPVTEVSDGADLARIKYYRNFMAHTEKDELSNEDFNTMWICVTNAIIRIGGVTYKPRCEDLSQMNLNKDILTYIRQDLYELRGEISDQIGTLKTQTAANQTSITLLHSECSAQGKDMKLLTKNVTTQIEDLALEIKKSEDDTIPKNIRAQHQQYLDEWKKDDHMFVVTKATKYVKSFLKYKRKNVVVVTGSSGNGKSSIIHHIALELCFKYGYEVIPFVTGPQDIINFRDPTTKQVFVVDDICGKEAINVSLVELWRDHSEKLAKIFEVNEEGKNNLSCTQMSSPKLLVSCRLHLYRDVHVKLLKLTLFKRSQCNLLSTELRLSNAEKMRMVKRYIPDKMCYSWGRETFDFFPLLCKLAVRKNSDEIKKLFLSPVDTIKDDLTQFITWQNNYQLCALVLCILFLNGFNPDWLKLEYAPILERDKIKNVVDECGININLERERECLKCCFESLELTYLKKFGNMYIMIHDKINEIAAFLYGHYLKECFIKYAPTSFVRDHYRFQSFERKENNKIIMLSENMEGEYLNRLIRDMKHGHIVSTLSNKNLVIDTIRAEIIKAFQHDPDVRLAMKQHSSSMYSAPIMEAAAQGFADIVKVLIDLKYVECDVNFSNWCWATPLFAACEGGHTAVVKLLLENGAKFYGYGEHGWSLLQVSCSKGHIGVVELLLQKSFGFFKKKKKKRSNRVTAYAAREKIGNYLNLSKVDDQGRSTLFLACKEGHTNIVKLLLDRNADPLKSNDRGQSPLMSACKKGHQNIVELLLKKNVNVNKKRKDGRAALHFACKGGYSAVVKLLIEYKANVSQRGWAGQSPLYEACEGGNIDVVTILLKNNADVTQSAKYGKTPLYAACKGGHSCIVKELLENKADIFQSDKFGKSPLYMACQTGNNDTVHLLLEKGANVNQCDQRNQSPFFVACGKGYLDIAKLLLNTINSISICDVHGQTPLHVACEGGHIDLVELLLDKGANINQQGRTKQTPIYFACSKGHIDVVNVLLNNNADVLIRNKYKRSPLYVACEMGYTYIVQLLLQHCADVLGCDKFGMSPLHTACKGGHEEIVKLLLQKNADIDQCDSYGQSTLHIACRGNNSQHDPLELILYDESYTDIVHILLEMHADVTLCDNQGFTPLKIAKKYGNVETVRLLNQKRLQ